MRKNKCPHCLEDFDGKYHKIFRFRKRGSPVLFKKCLSSFERFLVWTGINSFSWHFYKKYEMEK